jgi:hypothetical protein
VVVEVGLAVAEQFSVGVAGVEDVVAVEKAFARAVLLFHCAKLAGNIKAVVRARGGMCG